MMGFWMSELFINRRDVKCVSKNFVLKCLRKVFVRYVKQINKFYSTEHSINERQINAAKIQFFFSKTVDIR